MSTAIVSGNRMLRDGSWLFDRELEQRDNAAMAEYDRREAIERSVTRAELLEEITLTFTDAQDEAFMLAVARGNTADLHLIHALFLQAKEAIVKRRLAGDE